MKQSIVDLGRTAHGSALALFRFGFGIILFLHFCSQTMSGHLAEVYLVPRQLFPFTAFAWLPRPDDISLYALVAVLAICSLMIAVGYLFRIALVIFATGFLYLFLLEEMNYQNHYYLILLFAVLLFFSHAGEVYSFTPRGFFRKNDEVPERDYFLLRFQMAVVYFFAGLAKINPDWLRGQPLEAWLEPTVFRGWGLVFSYGGLALDLLIVPLLLYRRTRLPIFCVAIFFHLVNSFLFYIGIFPFLALLATTLFFDHDWPVQIWNRVTKHPSNAPKLQKRFRVAALPVIAWCAIQISLPLRHCFFPGRVAWTLQGYQFAWMMKLNMRIGTGNYIVQTSDQQYVIDPADFVTPAQAANMRADPVGILKFARFLRNQFESQGKTVQGVRANLVVKLNDHEPKPYVDPRYDLSRVSYLRVRDWILPPPE